MAQQQPKTEILFPIGRMVQGDLYEANTTDADGNPLIYKHGPDTGKPRIEYFFAVAIAKDGRPWWETEWGAKIFQTGVASFPQGQATSGQAFAWKVRDGDDTKVNNKGKRNCDREGFPGHWVLGFSGGFPPEVYANKGNVSLNSPQQKGLVKRGYFLQVLGNVVGNGSTQQPGVYLNFKMVDFSYAGTEIASEGQDAKAVGFGQGTVRPAGAIDAPAIAATPFAGQPAPAATPTMPGAPTAMPGATAMPAMPGPAAVMPGAPAMPAMPGAPAMPAMPGAAPVAAMPAMPAQPAPVAVTPHTAYMAAPAMPGAPAAPPAAPAPAVKSLDDRRTQSGMAYTVAQWFASGWNEQTLVANGHLLPY